jgi:hypothetical protein
MGNSTSYSSNDFELVIKTSKEIEYILEAEFKATGKGLHEKVSSVSSQLPPKLCKRLRFLATIRNRLIHERGFDAIPDRANFIAAFEESKTEIAAVLQERNSKHAHICVIS